VTWCSGLAKRIDGTTGIETGAGGSVVAPLYPTRRATNRFDDDGVGALDQVTDTGAVRDASGAVEDPLDGDPSRGACSGPSKQRVLDGPAERAVRAGILRLLAQQRGVAWLGATTDRGIGGRG
jgi:hypothetical protein